MPITWQDVITYPRLVETIVFAVFGITLVLGLGFFTFRTAPFLNVSILSFIENTVQTVCSWFGLSLDIRYYVRIGVIILLVLWREHLGSLVGVGPANFVENMPSFALREELMFRFGSERWNLIEKLRSCFSFGLIHITMIIVPIGAAFVLSMSGAIFMIAYLVQYKRTKSRRSSALHSAIVHTLYNALIVTLLSILLVVLLIV